MAHAGAGNGATDDGDTWTLLEVARVCGAKGASVGCFDQPASSGETLVGHNVVISTVPQSSEQLLNVAAAKLSLVGGEVELCGSLQSFLIQWLNANSKQIEAGAVAQLRAIIGSLVPKGTPVHWSLVIAAICEWAQLLVTVYVVLPDNTLGKLHFRNVSKGTPPRSVATPSRFSLYYHPPRATRSTERAKVTLTPHSMVMRTNLHPMDPTKFRVACGPWISVAAVTNEEVTRSPGHVVLQKAMDGLQDVGLSSVGSARPTEVESKSLLRKRTLKRSHSTGLGTTLEVLDGMAHQFFTCVVGRSVPTCVCLWLYEASTRSLVKIMCRAPEFQGELEVEMPPGLQAEQVVVVEAWSQDLARQRRLKCGRSSGRKRGRPPLSRGDNEPAPVTSNVDPWDIKPWPPGVKHSGHQARLKLTLQTRLKKAWKKLQFCMSRSSSGAGMRSSPAYSYGGCYYLSTEGTGTSETQVFAGCAKDGSKDPADFRPFAFTQPRVIRSAAPLYHSAWLVQNRRTASWLQVYNSVGNDAHKLMIAQACYPDSRGATVVPDVFQLGLSKQHEVQVSAAAAAVSAALAGSSAPVLASPTAPTAGLLPRSMDPLARVRDTTSWVVEQASQVSISSAAVESYARTLLSTAGSVDVDWDADGWHYSRDVATGGQLTCQYIFVLDTLNFCFWPQAGLEYDSLAVGLRNALTADPAAFSAASLTNVTADTVRAWVPRIPSVGARVAKLRELGATLQLSWGGMAINMVKTAQQSATQLVRLIVANLTGFQDHSVYRGQQVYFYKRAQILVGDLWAAFGRQTSGSSPFAFRDMHKLTMFADYRVPQILLSVGVLRYTKPLLDKIKAKTELTFGCEEEVEIRAATVQAVEQLRTKLAQAGKALLSVELDWLLWQLGERSKDRLLPHHRTMTVFY